MKSSESASSWRNPESRMEHARMKATNMDRGEMIVRAAFARFDLIALAVAFGAVCAIALWSATAILLFKGAPPGVAVGPHLALLTNFLPGYSVSWSGSLVGLFYGFLIGAVLGVLIALIWNLVHHVYLVAMVARRYFAGDL
jgi:hypothetical protein